MLELKRQIQNRIKTNRNQNTGIGRKADEILSSFRDAAYQRIKFFPTLELIQNKLPKNFSVFNHKQLPEKNLISFYVFVKTKKNKKKKKNTFIYVFIR